MISKRLAVVMLSLLMLCSVVGAASAKEISKAEKRKLILKGSKLWGMYCNQCHNARPPGEKAPYEWNQEILHMRTLGNIPAENARAILEYLRAR